MLAHAQSVRCFRFDLGQGAHLSAALPHHTQGEDVLCSTSRCAARVSVISTTQADVVITDVVITDVVVTDVVVSVISTTEACEGNSQVGDYRWQWTATTCSTASLGWELPLAVLQVCSANYGGLCRTTDCALR